MDTIHMDETDTIRMEDTDTIHREDTDTNSYGQLFFVGQTHTTRAETRFP